VEVSGDCIMADFVVNSCYNLPKLQQ